MSTTQLWAWRLDDVDASGDHDGSVLTPGERDRADRFSHTRDRDRFIISRARVRHILSHIVATPARDIVIGYGAHGKPFLRGGPEFNLSHAGRWALLAVAQQPIGVDIEFRKPVERGVADLVFDADELADWVASGFDEITFYRGWTRKEAVAKALGGGLTEMKTVSVSLGPVALARHQPEWRIVDLHIESGYSAALASKCSHLNVEWMTLPAGSSAARLRASTIHQTSASTCRKPNYFLDTSWKNRERNLPSNETRRSMQDRATMRLRSLNWLPSQSDHDANSLVNRTVADAIVLLHGYGHAADAWRPMMGCWHPSARVLAFDLPGHGRSPWLPTGDYEITTLADIVSNAMAAHGVHRPILVGHSLGARVCVELASRLSLDVRATILIDLGIEHRPEIISTINDHVETLRKGQPTFDLLFACVTAQLPLADFDAINTVIQSMAQKSNQGWHIPSDPASKALLSSGGGVELLEKLGFIHGPVGVIRGACSSVLNRKGAERIAASVSSRLVPVFDVPMAGHAVPLDSPRHLGRAISVSLSDLRIPLSE